MKIEFFDGFASKVRNTILQMAASDQKEAKIPGDAGLRLIREDSTELPERQSAEGGGLSVHEHEELKYYVCTF